MGPEDEIVEGQGSEAEVIDENPVAPDAEGVEEGGGESKLNPAWSDLLGVVPSQLHSQVTPHLQKWDQNFQSKINEVHSQYESFKPFLEQQVPADRLQYGLQLMQAIEERPGEVLAALKAAYEEEDEQKEEEAPSEEQGPTDITDIQNHPEFKKLNEMVQTMAQIFVQQNQTQQQAQEDEALETELSGLKEKFGEFDEEWVLTKALANPDKPLEEMVKAYHEFEKGVIAKQRKPGPRVLRAGGSAPDNQLDPKNLDDKGRRSLVANMLAQAAQGQNG